MAFIKTALKHKNMKATLRLRPGREKQKSKKAIAEDERIEEFLTRGVENVYPSKGFLEKLLKSGKKLKVYLGIDPTGPSLHIGHIVNLKNLAKFQKLGHQAIILIGDFTARIGDPTDKMAARKPLTHRQVLENAKKYKEQASKILDFSGENPAKIVFNSKWLDVLTLKHLSELGHYFTVPRLLERDMFQERLRRGGTITVTEFLYPLMQAYDSVFMNVDGEVGGNDQTFNMLCGRDLMLGMLGKEKFVVSGKLLVDPSGKKMGKTEGNMIALTDTPKDMYGKVMAQSDELILPYYELVTDALTSEIKAIENDLKDGKNPRDIKAKLAFEIVKMFYDEGTAEEAAVEFDKIFRDKEKPSEIPTFKIQHSTAKILILELLTKARLVSSKSEAKRMVEQGGVKIDGKKIDDFKKEIEVREGTVVQVGKRKFIRVRLA